MGTHNEGLCMRKKKGWGGHRKKRLGDPNVKEGLTPPLLVKKHCKGGGAKKKNRGTKG